ncbi:MAG: hypothetical protein DME00_33265 [Candidatus Rokuibacteriota bacterium]|nr:MAG: hypothetical protein DME00_33265 [Candidatus Rokubacteria bacterium]
MESLGQRLLNAQKDLALDLNDETDQTPTRDERAAELIADRLLQHGGSSSLARSSPDQSELKELRRLFEHI